MNSPENRPRNLVAAFSFILLALFSMRGEGQIPNNRGLPGVDPLQDRANRVTTTYSWIDLPMEGIYLNAIRIKKDEFFTGLQEATGLSFEGTEEFPEEITVYGLFRNIEEVMAELCRDNPFLFPQIDPSQRVAAFVSKGESLEDLSPTEMIARYRRPKGLTSPLGTGGIFYPGTLVVDGVVFPNQMHSEVTPISLERKVLLNVNGSLVKAFSYSDPSEVDRAYFSARTPEEVQSALKNKLDQTWRDLSSIPTETTQEVLTVMARQISYLPGVEAVRVGEATFALTLIGSQEKMEWRVPPPGPPVLRNEGEAFAAALDFQARLSSSLASGRLVMMSHRFGNLELDRGYEAAAFLNEIGTNPIMSLREKEIEIRKRWKHNADILLEVFYTSFLTVVPAELPRTTLSTEPDSLDRQPRETGLLNTTGSSEIPEATGPAGFPILKP